MKPGAVPQRTAEETVSFLGSNRQSGLSSIDARVRFDRQGANEIPERRPHRLLGFARKFWSLSAWMIELIAILSFLLHKYSDFGVAFALLIVNAILSFLQEQHASTAVAVLRRQLKVTSRVLRDGSWQPLPARELVPGDVVRLRTGDFVPADLQILDGEVRIDQSALTGESQDLGKTTNDAVYSGSIVRQGEANAIVVTTGLRTYFAFTTDLVESAHPKLHVEEVITRVVKWLFLIVGVQVVVLLAVSIAGGFQLTEILPLALVLLMSAVPVALPVMFTVTMAMGSIELARRGALVTRLSAAEDAANMNVLCADKTGTLTMNRLTLVRALPQPGFTENDVIRDGALASNEADQDPIDMAFLGSARERNLLEGTQITLAFVPFSATTRRTEATLETNGRRSRVMKGALHTVAEIVGLNGSSLTAFEASANTEAEKGFRILAVARADGEEPWRLVGLALLHDPPRQDSRKLLDELHLLGIAVKMLTGDALPVAKEIANELGIGEVVRMPELRAAQKESQERAIDLAGDSSGFAEVFPEDKFLVVKSLQTAGFVVGMTGDGVNDAPALRQAEVGIAVSGASDVAKGAASVVLTTEGLGSIVDLVKNGRAIYQRVLTWIINKVSRTILKSGFVVIAFLVTGKFVISALAMMLLVLMTDFAKIALSTDRTRPSQKPETWNILPLVKVGAILGLLMLIQALAVLAVGWRYFGLGNDNARLLPTFAFQMLLFFALFSIVSIRERRAFWSSLPSWPLASALAADAMLGVLLGTYGVADLSPLPLGYTVFIFGYAFVCSLVINDFVKVALIKRTSVGAV